MAASSPAFAYETRLNIFNKFFYVVEGRLLIDLEGRALWGRQFCLQTRFPARLSRLESRLAVKIGCPTGD